jgi:hypothetical protein
MQIWRWWQGHSSEQRGSCDTQNPSWAAGQSEVWYVYDFLKEWKCLKKQDAQISSREAAASLNQRQTVVHVALMSPKKGLRHCPWRLMCIINFSILFSGTWNFLVLTATWEIISHLCRLHVAYIRQRKSAVWFQNCLCGQSSWLQIQSSRFDSRRYQIFWEVVGLDWGPLSLVGTIKELMGRKCSGFSLEIWEYSPRDPSCWPRRTLYQQTLVLTLLTSGGRSVI